MNIAKNAAATACAAIVCALVALSPTARADDAALRAHTDLLRGVYSDGNLRIHFFDIAVTDAPNMLVGEFVQIGEESVLKAQILAQFIRRQGEITLRMYRFPAGTRMAPGLWAAPDLTPEIESSPLDIVGDLRVRSDDPENPTWIEASTGEHVPVHTRQAIEMSTKLRIDAAGFTIDEVGYDGQGEQVWTFPEQGPTTYARIDNPLTRVRRESGLIVVDLTEPADANAKVGEAGDEFTVHYYGWLPNGFLFDTSKQPGRDPFALVVPGGVIEGWNQGIIGMRVGTTRRLFIPPHLGYGERGAGGVIPPNSWLVFDVELVSLRKASDMPDHDGRHGHDHGHHDHDHDHDHDH